MSSSSSVPIIDISPFVTGADEAARRRASQKLSTGVSFNGIVGISGHGIPDDQIERAIRITKQFFDLPYQDKMKALHPHTAIPHRGYSGLGREQVGKSLHASNEAEAANMINSAERDHKESFELGSDQNKLHYNIWPPPEILPGFRKFMTHFHWDLHEVSMKILDALAASLELSEAETQQLRALHTGHDSNVRLLHYPSVTQASATGRLAAHRDWSSMTLLLQDANGGLEVWDQYSHEYIPAVPMPGILYMNIGDMLHRYSNGLFPSALHRVVVSARQAVTPARYSIPFFVVPCPDAIIQPPQSILSRTDTNKFEPVMYGEYATRLFTATNPSKA